MSSKCRGARATTGVPLQPAAAAYPATLTPSSQPAVAQPAGAEFFRRRLQRAMAIPPEQRDPAVHAFVSSVQLMQAAEELLPLTAAGEPALPPDTLAGQQAEVQAMLMAATAKYTGLGSSVEWEGEQLDRLGSYVYRRLGLAGDNSDSWDTAYLPALQPLGGLLLQCSCREQLLALRVWSAVAHDLAHGPASLRTAVTRQLMQLQQGAPHPLPQTCEQLEAAVHFKVLDYGLKVCKQLQNDAAQPRQQGTIEDCALAASALALSSQRLLTLDRANPKAILSAAAAQLAAVTMHPAHNRASGTEESLRQQCTRCHLRAFHAAQAMGSQYYAVVAAQVIFVTANLEGAAVSRDDLAALVAAVERAPALAKWLRGVLPHRAADYIQQVANSAVSLLPAVRAQLQGRRFPAAQQRAALSSSAAQLDSVNDRSICSGCGKQALGLRRCARCKDAACEKGGQWAAHACFTCIRLTNFTRCCACP